MAGCQRFGLGVGTGRYAESGPGVNYELGFAYADGRETPCFDPEGVTVSPFLAGLRQVVIGSYCVAETFCVEEAMEGQQ